MEKMRFEDIKIGKRHREDLGDLNALAQSINEVGLLHPPVVNENNELVAGYRRIKACREILGWEEIEVNVVPVEDVVRGEFDENEIRKNLTPSERVEISKEVLPKEKEEAKKRQEELGRTHGRGASENFSEGGEAKEITARKLGWSRPTLEKATKVVDLAEDESGKFQDIKEEMDRTGNVHKAYEKASRLEERREKKVEEKLPINEILNDDCREVLLDFPPKSINTILMDPPFSSLATDTFESRTSEEKKKVSDFSMVEDYFNQIFEECERLLTWDGHLLVHCDPVSYPLFFRAAYPLFDYTRCLVWYKTDGFGMGRGWRYTFELILHSMNAGAHYNKPDREDLIKCPRIDEVERYHPAQKPVELEKQILETCTPEEGIVLDPFLGTGSTILAASKLGLKYIGIELEEEYYNIAKKRIDELNE